MVDERLADGTRIARLLASEIDGRTDGVLAALSVIEANPDAEPTADGTFAYAIEAAGEASITAGERVSETGADGADRTLRLAEAYVHPDRAHVEFATAHEAVVESAEEAGLRVRPKATRPPRTLVFVEDGAEVKRAVSVVERAVQSN